DRNHQDRRRRDALPVLRHRLRLRRVVRRAARRRPGTGRRRATGGADRARRRRGGRARAGRAGDRRGVPAQPRPALRRRLGAPARPAAPGAARPRARHLLPGGRRHRVPGHPPGAGHARRRRPRLRGPHLVADADRPDRAVLPARAVRGPSRRLRRLPHAAEPVRPQDRQPRAGERHDLAPGVRDGLGVHADRRHRLPGGRREGHRVPAGAHALRRRGRGRDLLVPRHPAGRRPGDQALHLRVLRRLRRDPRVRADLRPRRPGPDLPRDGRRADPRRRRRHAAAVRAVLPRPRGRGLLVAHRPHHALAAPRVAAGQPLAQELELRRRPRPGVPHQPLPRHRRGAPRRHARAHVRHHRRALPGRRAQPVRQRALPRRLEPRPRAPLAAGPRRGGAQPEDRLEPHADAVAAPARGVRGARPAPRRPDARGRQRSPPRRVVRRRRAGAPRGTAVAPLHLARPQGVVAAGAGDPRLPGAGRHGGRRGAPAAGPGGAVVLQRLLPRPRRGRRVLQRARRRDGVPPGQRAPEGQPRDEHVPLRGAVLPRRDLLLAPRPGQADVAVVRPPAHRRPDAAGLPRPAAAGLGAARRGRGRRARPPRLRRRRAHRRAAPDRLPADGPRAARAARPERGM
ncbi:MAG: FIG01132818: hypothetical protein, partial [uncultured Pseudonocardia sp.]